jgi:hypothetical protein
MGFHDASYNKAAVNATLALCRALIEKGILAREDAVQMLLDEAVAHAIQAEAQPQEPGPGVTTTTIDISRECAEILKLLAEKF